jgi:hypothetical protein
MNRPLREATSPLPPRAHIGLRHLATGLLLFTALAYLWSSLATIANFAFRYPAFDQYRLYPIYLGLPFPESAIQLENGHRPILPALVRLAEIHWFQANQWLQVGTGLAFALAALALIAWAAMREHGLDALQKGAALLFATLALWWLGNARMLMHGNELVHAYLVVLLMVCMAFAVHAARGGKHSAAWMATAATCAVAASFSFGSGLACFPALFAGVLVARLPRRALVLPSLALAGVLVSYVLGLPGGNGVRNVVAIDTVGNLDALAMFLSSPWMNAWLGVAEPPLFPDLQRGVVQAGGRILVESASAVAAAFGADGTRQASRLIGAFGAIAWLLMLADAWREGPAIGRIRLLAAVMSTFGIGVAAIVAITRLQLFQSHPLGILSDRYLPWSCLFWLGLALHLACETHATQRRQFALATMALLCAVALVPTQLAFAGWSATVHRKIQQSALAAQLGIWDDERFPDNADARRTDVLDSLALLRARHLSMFAEPTYRLIESGWRFGAKPTPSLVGASARVVRNVDDPRGPHHVAAIEGWIPRIDGLSGAPTLIIVDASGVIRGAAKPSHFGPRKRSLRFSLARMGGYDGYILDPAPGESFDLVVLDSRLEVVGVAALAGLVFDPNPVH